MSTLWALLVYGTCCIIELIAEKLDKRYKVFLSWNQSTTTEIQKSRVLSGGLKLVLQLWVSSVTSDGSRLSLGRTRSSLRVERRMQWKVETFFAVKHAVCAIVRVTGIFFLSYFSRLFQPRVALWGEKSGLESFTKYPLLCTYWRSWCDARSGNIAWQRRGVPSL